MKRNQRYERIPFEDTALPIRINFGMLLHPHHVFRPEFFSWHEQIELLYFRKGEGTVYCGDRSFDAHPNEIVLINPFEVHQVVYKSGAPEYDCLMIDASLYHNSVQEAGENRCFDLLTDHHVCFENLIVGDEELLSHIQALCQEVYRKEFGFELAIKSHVYGLFVNLFRRHIYSGSSFRRLVENTDRYDRIKPALIYMKVHLKEHITLEDLAEACHLSSSHFCRLFHQITGYSPIRYLLDIRLQEAATMLKRPEQSITQIADEVGFEDVGYFSRKFKEQFGLSPSQVQKRNNG